MSEIFLYDPETGGEIKGGTFCPMPTLEESIGTKHPKINNFYLLRGLENVGISWNGWKEHWLVMVFESSPVPVQDRQTGLVHFEQREAWKPLMVVPESMGGAKPDQRLLNYLAQRDQSRGADARQMAKKAVKRDLKLSEERQSMKEIQEQIERREEIASEVVQMGKQTAYSFLGGNGKNVPDKAD